MEHVASMGEERRVLGFGGEWVNRATLKGNIMCIWHTWWEGVKWVKMGHDCDKWQAVVSTVMNIRFP